MKIMEFPDTPRERRDISENKRLFYGNYDQNRDLSRNYGTMEESVGNSGVRVVNKPGLVVNKPGLENYRI